MLGFNQIFEQLRQLKLSIYAPVSYILSSRLKKYEELYDTEVSGGGGKPKQADREKSLVALMTTNLLKRLESSVEAFRRTLQSLHDNHQRLLGIIDEFYRRDGVTEVSSLADALDAIEADEDELPSYHDMEIGNKIKIKLADMDLTSWQQDMQGDLELIADLLAVMQKVTPAEDAKLQHLKEHLAQKIATPINPGNRKVIIFTAFADTASYLYEQLAPELQGSHGLHAAMVTGGTGLPKTTLKTRRKGYDIQEVLTLFSPQSKSKASVLPDEPAEIDLLIATDCISEGQNLQDCDYLINYDIH
ncbi:SWF/SNF helicase family protein [Oceanimonas sp. NS1]|nr:SWF/SNF helicase family protein [Oceanimonas sp. NS1]